MESRLLTHLTFLLATQSNDDGVRETRRGHIRPHLWTPLAARCLVRQNCVSSVKLRLGGNAPLRDKIIFEGKAAGNREHSGPALGLL